MLGDEIGKNVAMFAEQQHDLDTDLPQKVFDVYVRVREKWRQPTTCIVIYTGEKSTNVNIYTESCFGCEVSMKFRTYYLPEKSADELRADSHTFAPVMLTARLALDAGDSIELREKYALEIEETTANNEMQMFIVDFARRIFRLDDEKISEHVKGVYRMHTIPLEEYRKRIRLQGAKEEAAEAAKMEVARSLLADGMSLQQVAKHTRLPFGELQQLQPH